MTIKHKLSSNPFEVSTKLSKSVSIRRDKYSIPYIESNSPQDAWFGLGFVQGMDRPFQLEYLKRQANGSLSEIFGTGFLLSDRYKRIIGLQRTAEEYVKELHQESSELLSSFSLGVNEGIKCRKNALFDPFTLLGIEPSPFTPADVISIQLLLSLSLTHWLGKITRFLLLGQESPEIVNELDPEYAAWNYVITPVAEKAGIEGNLLYQELLEISKTLNLGAGSNSWVLTGSKTKRGLPIIANDPHLSADIPAPWYLASVKCQDFHVCGACYPGSPIFFNGHNDHVAWGMTAAFIDNTDIFLEKLDPSGDAFLENGSYHLCKEVVEKIKIKDQEPHFEKVLITKHGPIISPALNSKKHAFSLCATWLKPKPINGFFSIHRCQDVHEVRQVFKDWPLTSTNLVIADTAGNIAWQLCGEIPNRTKTKGMLPMPGWDLTYVWKDDTIPFKDNPYLINPPNGFIATANNKHTNDKKFPYTGRDFIDGYRHARIVKLLQSREKWDLLQTGNMQRDQYSEPWFQIRDTILHITPISVEVQRALEILRQWDGDMKPNSIATTIHEYFIAEITKDIVKEIAPNSWDIILETYNPAVGSACFAMSRISQVVKCIREQPKSLFNGDWDKKLNSVMEIVIKNIISEFGSDESNWEWGKVRPLVIKHLLNRNLKEFQSDKYNKLLNLGPIPWGGNEQTLCVAAGNIFKPTTTPDFIPNLQSVIEVGDWDSNIFCLAGGQEEYPQTKHYDDLFNLWVKGKGTPIRWNEVTVDKVVNDEMILVSDQFC